MVRSCAARGRIRYDESATTSPEARSGAHRSDGLGAALAKVARILGPTILPLYVRAGQESDSLGSIEALRAVMKYAADNPASLVAKHLESTDASERAGGNARYM